MVLTTASAGTLTVLKDPDTVAAEVAAWLTERATASHQFVVCLSGGSTPKRLFEKLASPAFIELFPWGTTHWFWGDERFVPTDSPDSNFGMTKRTMLDAAPVPEANVHAIPTDLRSAEAAADAYEAVLKRFYGAPQLDPDRALFDVTFLGLGPDGHTASLIPGEPVLDERQKWVAAVTHGRPEARITLTYPPLESSRAIAFLVTGADKAPMLSHVRSGARDVPAGRLTSTGEIHWFVDRAAAGDV